MNIIYNNKTDLPYLRLNEKKRKVINRRVSEDVVLDIGEKNTIIGIEIMDASKHINPEHLLPVRYQHA